MKINTNKIKVMMTARKQVTIIIQLRNEKITQFKYLGIIIESNGKQKADMDGRIDKVIRTCHAMREGFICKREISCKTKMNNI